VKTTNIAELKNRLSFFLDRVRRGETVLVLDRTTAIARIVPVEAPSELTSEREAAWLRGLEARGILRLGALKGVPEIWETPPPGDRPVNAVEALLEERGAR
jgi:prevent-host-death family protein